MKKYKVGDRVRVRPDLKAGERYKQDGESRPLCQVAPPMAALAGKVVTIVEGPYFDRYCVAGSIFQWTDDMFEGLAGAKKIVVTTDGETTTARLFSGKELVKSATAKCSPHDEFVFETGAALALDRLLGQEKKAEPEVPKFTKADLKTGLFGRMSDGRWFVVVGEKLLYALAEGGVHSGGFDNISSLDESLIFNSGTRIDFVIEACSFFNAQVSARRGRFLWSRPGVEFE